MSTGSRRRAQVMVANIRCEELMQEQIAALENDQAWQGLRSAAEAGIVDGFGRQTSDLLQSCIQG